MQIKKEIKRKKTYLKITFLRKQHLEKKWPHKWNWSFFFFLICSHLGFDFSALLEGNMNVKNDLTHLISLKLSCKYQFYLGMLRFFCFETRCFIFFCFKVQLAIAIIILYCYIVLFSYFIKIEWFYGPLASGHWKQDKLIMWLFSHYSCGW